jgi:hypothetical protein
VFESQPQPDEAARYQQGTGFWLRFARENEGTHPESHIFRRFYTTPASEVQSPAYYEGSAKKNHDLNFDLPVRVGVIDFDEAGIKSCRQFNIGETDSICDWKYERFDIATMQIRDPVGKGLAKFLRDNPNHGTRIIIVEDLSAYVIDAIGEGIHLTPSFLERHITSHRDFRAGEANPFFTITWCRPVRFLRRYLRHFVHLMGSHILSELPRVLQELSTKESAFESFQSATGNVSRVRPNE